MIASKALIIVEYFHVWNNRYKATVSSISNSKKSILFNGKLIYQQQQELSISAPPQYSRTTA